MSTINRYRPSTISLALSLAILFLLAHPYTGIRHDAVLYTAQALYNAHPAHFAHDLFFEFGSQDHWTIYGKVYGMLVSAFGLRASNLACLIFAQALWWGGMWRLAKALLPPPGHWLCVFLVGCMPSYYGAYSGLSYDEAFLTARLPAEALGLWAISLMLERRHLRALMLTVVASAVHPLIGGASLAIVVLAMTSQVKWWQLLPFALVAFAVIELLPFEALHLHPFDSEWREIARFNQRMLFPTLWHLWDWSKACWSIALPAALCATGSQENRKLWSNLTLVGVAGIAFSTVADLTGRDAAWIELQTWRTLWLLALMQWPAALQLARVEIHRRPALIWVLGICWLLLDVGGGIVALLIAIALYAVARHKSPGTAPSASGEIPIILRRVLISATLVALVIWFFFQEIYAYRRMAFPTGSVAFAIPGLEAIIHTRLVVALVTLLVLLLWSRNRFSAVGLPITLAMLAAYGLINIDQRSEEASIVEAQADRADLVPFNGVVAHGDMVYWDGPSDEIVYPWLMMRTSSYFSPYQASGMIFHRKTTFDSLRRFERIRQDPYAARPRHNNDEDPKSTLFPPPQAYGPLTQTGLKQVCADPQLDFVVSRRHYAGLSTDHTWSPRRC
ncbi:hypothetical protein J8I87_18050 [Paraburkholderia sp. LEh10]|uniref:hypothetical protein n=1 Tax=Paraburkholderia sp. LEh10 TaxID=2821353 RepID=UPI001AE6376A|nr:hypothetical protein [Paraburkholderia sp. LEh10]MBP0591595.1 hypothetical protein [Paraburkholderia sp. LEh10]